MRIVLDTNVLVAGLLKPFGPCGAIVRTLTRGDLELCVDGRILFEYREVLHRDRFDFDPTDVDTLMDFIHTRSLSIAAMPLSEPLPDPDDLPFLEVAIAAKAEYLVTGNAKHFPTRCRQGMKVVSPSQFLQILKRVP